MISILQEAVGKLGWARNLGRSLQPEDQQVQNERVVLEDKALPRSAKSRIPSSSSNLRSSRSPSILTEGFEAEKTLTYRELKPPDHPKGVDVLHVFKAIRDVVLRSTVVGDIVIDDQP